MNAFLHISVDNIWNEAKFISATFSTYMKMFIKNVNLLLKYVPVEKQRIKP